MWKKQWGGQDQEWGYQRDSCAECFRDDAEVGTSGWEEKEENSEWSKRGCQLVWEKKMQRIREDGCSWLAVAKPEGNPWKKFFYVCIYVYMYKLFLKTHTKKSRWRQCKQNYVQAVAPNWSWAMWKWLTALMETGRPSAWAGRHRAVTATTSGWVHRTQEMESDFKEWQKQI